MNQRLELMSLPDATCAHAATHSWTKRDTRAPDEVSIKLSVTAAAAETIFPQTRRGGNRIIMVKQSVCISVSYDLHGARAHPARALQRPR